MWKWRMVFLYKGSAMLSQVNRFSLISTRKYKKSVHYLNNCPLFTSFSLYIFSENDTNFTMLGHSLNTSDFILKWFATIGEVWLNFMLFL